MKIDVTQQDIDNGKRWNCRECPIALAVCRILHRYCEVGMGRVTFDNKESFYLSTEMIRFIDDFDMGRPVHPFSFDIPDALVASVQQ